MKPEKKVVLWSQPIITGRSIGNDLKNGMGSLMVANIGKRSIEVHHEFFDSEGASLASGYNTVAPGKVAVTNCLNATVDSRKYMYCKLWFNGSKREIRASLIMSTVEGPPGSETETPVYGMTLS